MVNTRSSIRLLSDIINIKHIYTSIELVVLSVSFEVTGLQNTNAWIKFNADETGFYRVNYPVSMWQRLSTLLNCDRMVSLETTLNVNKNNHTGVLTFTRVCM